MRNLKKTTYQFRMAQKGPLATTELLIKFCLAQYTQPQGFSMQDLRDRDRIDKAIDSAKDKKEIKLEDADFASLSKIVHQARWQGRHPDMLAFIDEFEK